MIARIWHGVVSQDVADKYYHYMNETGFDHYKKTPGFIELKVLRRNEANLTHYLIVTYWDSYDSIIKFAGEDYTKAQYYPKDHEYLVEMEELVDHYEVVTF